MNANQQVEAGGLSPPMDPFPEYKRAISELFFELINDLVCARDPILRDIGRKSAPHFPENPTTPETSFGYQAPLPPAEMKFVVRFDDALNTSIEGWAASISDAADELLPQIVEGFFSAFRHMSETVGNTLHANGKPLSADLLLDMLDKMEMSFDDEGKPSHLKLVVSPADFEKLKTMPMTPENQRRWEDIVERKRNQSYARRRVRKLDKDPK